VGIYTTEILLGLSREELKQAWGSIVGEHFYEWVRGNDTAREENTQQSFSQSHVLSPELRNFEDAYQVTQKLLHKAAFRLRKEKFWTRSMLVSIQFMGDEESRDQRIRLLECQDDFSLMGALAEAWSHLKRPPLGRELGRPLKVGVVLSDLIPDLEHNLSLFENEKALNVVRKLDEINAKFGRGSIYFGGSPVDQEVAPSRIAFTSIPDFDGDH